jgi:O-antigen/teichoic acid export membrane protein
LKTDQIKAGAFLSYLSLFLNTLVSLLYTPYMLFQMGQSEYGLYSLAVTVVGYLAVLDFGFGSAVIRYTAKYKALNNKEEEFNLNGMFLVIYTLIGLVTAGIGALVYLNADNMFAAHLTLEEIGKAKIIILLLVLNLSVSFPLCIFSSIISAYEEFIYANLINIVRILLGPCVLIPLLLLGYRAVGMAAATTVINLCILMVNMWFCLSRLKIKFYFNHRDLRLLIEICAFSFYGFLNIIVDRITWSSGHFILGVVSGTVAVAVYAIAIQVNNYYLAFSTALSGLFLPKLTAMVTNGATDHDFSELFIKIGRIQYLIIAYILGGFLCVGQDFINAWAGPGYEDAYLIACLLMIPVTIPLIQNTGISILQAQNRQRFRSVTYLILAVVNIALSIPLGKLYGGIGCAVGTAVALLCGSVLIMNIYYYKVIHLDIPRFWREIARMTLPAACALVICFLLRGLGKEGAVLTILFNGFLYTATYVPLTWFFGMNSYERELVLLYGGKGKRLLLSLVKRRKCYD